VIEERMPRAVAVVSLGLLLSAGLAGAAETGGYALIAWPAEYGRSGIMTFLVNSQGVVFQKDLGAQTAEAVNAMTAYDPDASWTPTR
jgi:Protein of unknown function (DUF2950)